ncbi:hypothetical protein MVEN_02229300 [Mycena venus]|uniref:F-box domain-containing protein n=1 Tax=Mycena venus TaxID=2733690 RepID=A0A8H6X7X5_9AGAR|nr:hypothetical protein MVEN_02229300 [Mycena venus]
MVLTHRAAIASKTIVRWLPNEILAAMMQDVSKLDLIALYRTSRLICKIATLLLYRIIHLSTIPQIESFIRTIKRRSKSSAMLSRHVRKFSIAQMTSTSSCSRASIKESPPFSQFSFLEYLDLYNYTTDFMDVLCDAHFP